MFKCSNGGFPSQGPALLDGLQVRKRWQRVCKGSAHSVPEVGVRAFELVCRQNALYPEIEDVRLKWLDLHFVMAKEKRSESKPLRSRNETKCMSS